MEDDVRDSTKRGFTLVELLIAVSIFSVLIVTIYSSFRSGIAARKKGETVVELVEVGESSLRQIASDLANAPAISNPGFIGQATQVSFVTLKSNSGGEIPSIRHVSYELAEEGDGSPGVLWRGYRIPGRMGDEGAVTDACIREIRFRYAHRENVEDEVMWLDFWLGTDETPLPLAVEITLVLVSDGETLKLSRVVSMPVALGLERINATS